MQILFVFGLARGIYPETPAMMDEFLRIYSAAVRSLGI